VTSCECDGLEIHELDALRRDDSVRERVPVVATVSDNDAELVRSNDSERVAEVRRDFVAVC
jgi:hypothetical protein